MVVHAGHVAVDCVQLWATAKHEAAVVVEVADKVPGICDRDGLVGVIQQRGLIAVDCDDCKGIGGLSLTLQSRVCASCGDGGGHLRACVFVC